MSATQEKPAQQQSYVVVVSPARLRLIAIALASLAVIIGSLWPGWWHDLIWTWVGFWMVMLIPVFLVLAVLVGLRLLSDLSSSNTSSERRRAALSEVLIIGFAWLAVSYNVALRIAFYCCETEFLAIVDRDEPPTDERIKLNETLGMYKVDVYAIDSRGGTFFRTHAAAEGISPDTLSIGFAHRPNRYGTPFGSARYELNHLYGDWYLFSVSDDW